MKFKINTYYTLSDKSLGDSTFGLYKCIAIEDKDVVFETFYSVVNRLDDGFDFIKFESNDFWPYHIDNLHKMAEIENYDIFKSIIKKLFFGER